MNVKSSDSMVAVAFELLTRGSGCRIDGFAGIRLVEAYRRHKATRKVIRPLIVDQVKAMRVTAKRSRPSCDCSD